MRINLTPPINTVIYNRMILIPKHLRLHPNHLPDRLCRNLSLMRRKALIKINKTLLTLIRLWRLRVNLGIWRGKWTKESKGKGSTRERVSRLSRRERQCQRLFLKGRICTLVKM